MSQYIHCFYWATLTLSVINDNLAEPLNRFEYAFTAVNYLFGVFVVATIIGEVSLKVLNMHNNNIRNHTPE